MQLLLLPFFFFYVLTCNFHIVDLLLNVDSSFGSNNFTGPLPSELGNLVILVALSTVFFLVSERKERV